MKKLIIISYLLLTSFVSCQKAPPDNTQYTVTGRVVNATENTVYVGPISLEVRTSNFYPGYESQTLATGNTDASGNYSLTYTHTSITDKGASIYVVTPYFAFGGLVVNQTVSHTFYNSSKGNLKIILQTKVLLETSNDTLFLAIGNGSTREYEIDTIIKTVNGFYKTIRANTPPVQGIYWGRGRKNFIYNSTDGTMTYAKSSVNPHISGDPIVDSTTINY